jgi:hypothetical protein
MTPYQGFGPQTERLDAWLESKHHLHWVPGRSGGRIVHRDAFGRFAKRA